MSAFEQSQARPIPLPAPVTMATFPFRDIYASSLSELKFKVCPVRTLPILHRAGAVRGIPAYECADAGELGAGTSKTKCSSHFANSLATTIPRHGTPSSRNLDILASIWIFKAPVSTTPRGVSRAREIVEPQALPSLAGWLSGRTALSRPATRRRFPTSSARCGRVVSRPSVGLPQS
jgi:hypothetical protein